MQKNDQDSNQQNDCCDNKDQSCCSTPTQEKKSSWKKITSIAIMAFAFILAISAGVKASQQGDGCGSISITDFKWMDTDAKVAFVLLKGTDENTNKDLKSKLAAISADLKAANETAAMFILEQSDKRHTELATKFKVTSFPAIATLGRGCKSSVMIKDVTDASLADAFISASTPAASCSSTSSSCCSKSKND
ncbi:MAG TPA: hypothetical protein ENK52_03600 [Saprospiraceae bacterium]|nr:hypothetical protein [Saprospiraceae bacterium]